MEKTKLNLHDHFKAAWELAYSILIGLARKTVNRRPGKSMEIVPEIMR